MALYTAELRDICEVEIGNSKRHNYVNVEEIISKAREKIFNFSYPIFDENYRPVLETKILKHYYTQEIGYETYGRWKLALNARLNEIMPYYNKLYQSELLEFNPFYDVDYTKDHAGKSDTDRTDQSSNEGRVDGNTTHNANGETGGRSTTITNESSRGTDTRVTDTNDTRDITSRSVDELSSTVDFTDKTTTSNKDESEEKFSDTPQGGLNGMSSVRNNMYLTNATIRDGSSNGTSNTTDKTTTKSNDTTSGTDHDAFIGHKLENTNRDDSGNSQTETTDSGTSKLTETGSSNQRTTGSSSSSGTIKNVDEYIEHVRGKVGTQSYTSLLTEFRNTFLNIDMLIINNLSDLFVGLWM